MPECEKCSAPLCEVTNWYSAAPMAITKRTLYACPACGNMQMVADEPVDLTVCNAYIQATVRFCFEELAAKQSTESGLKAAGDLAASGLVAYPTESETKGEAYTEDCPFCGTVGSVTAIWADHRKLSMSCSSCGAKSKMPADITADDPSTASSASPTITYEACNACGHPNMLKKEWRDGERTRAYCLNCGALVYG